MRYSADDLELSCDETTLLEADAQKRHQYADILLRTAGDERGFTTCLSASAAALRYRLRNIMNAKERFSGTILVGLFFFCLMISCGHIALAYNESTGHEYIFSNEDCSTYSISSIRRQSDAGYSSFDLTDETLMNNIDETAICHYLSGLSLSHMTGNYSKKLAASLLSVSFRGPHGPVYVYLQENAVVVHSIQKEKPATEMYHCNEEIDWDYLDSLLTASPATS